MFETKKNLRWSKIKVGLIGTAALLVMVLAVLFAGNIEGLFGSRVELSTQVQNVQGLRKGAPVWLFGTEVGQVKRIELSPDRGTVVSFTVDEKAFSYLRTDAFAKVYTMGLLGDKYIELMPGTPGLSPIQPGDLIQGEAQMDLGDVMATSASTVRKVTELMEKLEPLVRRIGTGEGTLAKLLSDPALYNRMISATNSLEAFSRKLNEGSGTLQGLVEDKKLYEDLKKAAGQLSDIVEKVDKGEGLAGALVRDEGLARDLKIALEEFRLLAKDIKENPNKYFKFSIF